MAHNGVVIASIPKASQMMNFLLDMLEKNPEEHLLRVVDGKDKMVHVLRKGEVMVFAETNKKDEFRICNAFLVDVDEEFQKLEKKKSSQVKTLLKERLKFYNDPKNDKITSVQRKLDNVKETMIDNMEKMMRNYQVTQSTQVAAQEIGDTANLFKKDTTKMLWWHRFLYILSGAWLVSGSEPLSTEDMQ